MSGLLVRNACVAYGRREVLRGVSLPPLLPGSVTALIGPNGAGKSTLLRGIAGLQPMQGAVLLDGVDLACGPQALRAQSMVYLPQSLPSRTRLGVFEAVLSAAMAGRSEGWLGARVDAAAVARVEAVLARLDLLPLAGRQVEALSGGQRQLVGLAQALVRQPRVLLLDEPTTGLDPQARHLMWERLQRLLAEGKSILLTTHFMDEAERLCQRLLVLDHGRKIAEGRPRELIAEHLEPEVVEVYGQGALQLAESALAAHAERVERSGETVFFYTRDARPLMQALQAHPQLRTLHRPANLEDLFLKLTGRQIREDG